MSLPVQLQVQNWWKLCQAASSSSILLALTTLTKVPLKDNNQWHSCTNVHCKANLSSFVPIFVMCSILVKSFRQSATVLFELDPVIRARSSS